MSINKTRRLGINCRISAQQAEHLITIMPIMEKNIGRHVSYSELLGVITEMLFDLHKNNPDKINFVTKYFDKKSPRSRNQFLFRQMAKDRQIIDEKPSQPAQPIESISTSSLDAYINDLREKLPEMCTSFDLVEAGLFNHAYAVHTARYGNGAPKWIRKGSRTILFPRDGVLDWAKKQYEMNDQ